MEDLFKNEIKDFRWCHFLVTMRGVDPGISLLGKQLFKGELHSNYIFLHFALIGLKWDTITLFTKMNFFFFQKLHFNTICTRYIYIYLCSFIY